MRELNFKSYEYNSFIIKNRKEIINIISRYTNDEIISEDIYHDALLKAYRSYDGYRGESSLKTWVTGIAINMAKDYMRKENGRKKYIADEYAMSVIPTNKDVFCECNTKIMIEEALKRLPDKLENVIYCVYFRCFSMAETAKILNVSEGTVKSRLSRAKSKLRLILSET